MALNGTGLWHHSQPGGYVWVDTWNPCASNNPAA